MKWCRLAAFYRFIGLICCSNWLSAVWPKVRAEFDKATRPDAGCLGLVTVVSAVAICVLAEPEAVALGVGLIKGVRELAPPI